MPGEVKHMAGESENEDLVHCECEENMRTPNRYRPVITLRITFRPPQAYDGYQAHLNVFCESPWLEVCSS